MRPSCPLRVLLPCALLTVPLAHSQGSSIQVEGTIRTEYAEVLRVEPVYLPAPEPEQSAHCAPMLQIDPAQTPRADTGADCIPLQSGQQERGAQVLYDVDYVLRGVKYRSRLPYDPGNRLQVQLSVTPLIPPDKP